jgi:hypothetical protein
MMRSWSNRSDTIVGDEPFYADLVVLSASGEVRKTIVRGAGV